MTLLAHEEVVVRRGERSGLYLAVAVHSTALGPALGGRATVAVPGARRRDRRCAPALGGDDLQGGGGRARSRGWEGGALRTPGGRAAGGSPSRAHARSGRRRRVTRGPLRDRRGRRHRHGRHDADRRANLARRRPAGRIGRLGRPKPRHGAGGGGGNARLLRAPLRLSRSGGPEDRDRRAGARWAGAGGAPDRRRRKADRLRHRSRQARARRSAQGRLGGPRGGHGRRVRRPGALRARRRDRPGHDRGSCAARSSADRRTTCWRATRWRMCSPTGRSSTRPTSSRTPAA